MTMEERITRNVKVFGNGAHIFVPKAWAGEQILLVRPKKNTIKERIIEALDPYLDSIIGVYLYGSHARDEQKDDSDIDLFVITDKKIKIRAKGFEIISLEQKEIEKAIKLEPLLMHSILSEAKPIINSGLIEELKSKYKPKLSEFTSFIEDCKRMIKVNEDFIEEKAHSISSEAVIYSLVLRLRGLFILRSLLEDKPYTHKYFKQWIAKSLPEIDFSTIYEAYRLSKHENKIKQKVKVKDLKILLEFLKNEIHSLENGKKRKKT